MPTKHHAPHNNGTEQPRANGETVTALGYIRVSTRKQSDDDKDGPDRQRRAIQAFADLMGYKIVAWFQDTITGTTEQREDFARMLEALKHGEAKIVIVERFDRLARRMITGEMCAGDIREEGGVLYDCAGNNLTEPDNGDPDKVLIRQIMGAIAQHAKSIAVLRMKAARDRIRARGEYCGGPPKFGCDDQEKQVLARIRELWVGGLPVHKVTEQLTAEGIRTRRGFIWTRAGVDRIIQRIRKADPKLRDQHRRNRTQADRGLSTIAVD